jgi:HEAT repeat protein/TolA-binding protein
MHMKEERKMAKSEMTMKNKMMSAALAVIAALAMAIPAGAQSGASTGGGQGRASSSTGNSAQRAPHTDEALQRAQAALERAGDVLNGNGLDLAELSAQLSNLSRLSELSKLSEFGSLDNLHLEDLSLEFADLTRLGALAQIQGGIGGGIPGGVGGGISGGVSGGVSGGIGGGVGSGISGGVYAFGASDAQEEREIALYNDGTSAMDEGKWEKALDRFSKVAELHGKKADAALYYMARAQNKLGRRDEALGTLSSLEKEYPKSRWLNDARVLEIEIKQKTGQPVSAEGQSDCELKLYALNGLQQADPEKAVPLLEKMLHGGDCPKLSKQAFFILAQSGSQQAQEVIAKIARGESNPDLQRQAIQALGMYGGSYGREALGQIFTSSNDVDTKKSILRALMMSGDKTRMLDVAKSEKSPEVRAEAIRQLGMMGGREEIWQLYQTETSVEVKKQILQAMWMSGDRQRVGEIAMKETDHSLRLAAINDLGLMGRDSDAILVNIYNSDPDPEIRKKVLNSLFLAGDRERMGDLAKNEKDHDLRLSAINYLGLMGKQSDEILIGIYKSDPDPEVRKKVINALFLAGDAKGLVDIARSETDPNMKKAIVSQLSLMRSKEAMDYLMELLNK